MADPSPEITVVIPTHNRRDLLLRTLACALNQEGVDHEVIVVDDGSRDGTAEVVRAIGDPRIRVYRNEVAGGVSRARNRGIEEARGEWVAFLDDDDLWAPDKLASQLAAALETGRAWAYSGTVAISADTFEVLTSFHPRAPEEVARWLPWRNTVVGGASSVMATRELLERVGGFDPTLRHMADWDLWIRLATVGGLPAIVPRPLLAYVQHPANASTDVETIRPELIIMEKRYSHLRKGAPADRAYVYRWMAWNAIRSGNRARAIRCYLLAVRSGDLRSVARLGLTILHPSIHRWITRRQRPSPAAVSSAESWLAALPATKATG